MTNRDLIRLRNAVFTAYHKEVGSASNSQLDSAIIVGAVRLIGTEDLLAGHNLDELAQLAVAAFVDSTLTKRRNLSRSGDVTESRIYTTLFFYFSAILPGAPLSDTDRVPETLQLLIDPGDASTEQITAVLEAINELHVAAGGLGIEFDVGGLYAPALVGVRG